MLSPLLQLCLTGTIETAQMVGLSLLFAELLGFPLGVALVITEKEGLCQNIFINRILGTVVNAARSIPFIILLVAVIPLTRSIVGTSIGTAAAIVPLSLAAIPFVARMTETSLKEINKGVVDASKAMGATPWQIITKVFLPEALPSLISGITITAINLVGYSAMAGAIGGGGLGDLAIRYGYQRFQADVMIATVVILLVAVQLTQFLGDAIARRFNHE